MPPIVTHGVLHRPIFEARPLIVSRKSGGLEGKKGVVGGRFSKPSVLYTEGAYDPVGGIFDRSRAPASSLNDPSARLRVRGVQAPQTVSTPAAETAAIAAITDESRVPAEDESQVPAATNLCPIVPVTAMPEEEDHGDLYEQLRKLVEPGVMTVKLDGEDVFIFVDPDRGPRWGQKPDDFVSLKKTIGVPILHADSKWEFLDIEEKRRVLIVLAKKFRQWGYTGKGVKNAGEEEEEEGPEKTPEEIEEIVKEGIQRRCDMEWRRPPVAWRPITIDSVTANHRRTGVGMFYNLEFPWTEAMLLDMGPDWLTKAFHAAGTLDRDNKITKIIPEKKLKITTGNNGGKFLFDVKYAKKRAGLHTRLFAKVPFPLEGATRSDRLSSSVNKQPQEFYEINTSRLLEATLPVKMPKYYFGDINNDTSNWIFITEAIPFGDPEPLNFGVPFKRRRRLPANLIEGPYDKCMDHTLRGKPLNYYTLLVKTGAKIAGYHKTGKLGPEELLRMNFGDMADKPATFFGLAIGAASGDDPRTVKPKLDIAFPFIHDIGRVLFPDFATEEWCNGKLKDLMLNMNAYSGEISFWKHSNQDYVALTHINLNVDNAYFWRDEENALQVGVFDWGNMGSSALGHKLWWWLYCMDYDNFKENLDHYVSTFIEAYEEHGGPRLDAELLRWHVIMTSFEQMLSLLYAVPQIYKMCPKGEWPSIENRYDPRISENKDGKSTLRLYLHVLNSIVQIIEEFDGPALFDRFVSQIWAGEFHLPPKPPGIITGETKTGMGL